LFGANGVVKTTDWRNQVRAESVLAPSPSWNKREPLARQLPERVTVLRIIEHDNLPLANVFVVRSKGGDEIGVPALCFDRLISA